MVEFSDFIEDLSIIDLQLGGGAYTWYRGDTYITASRIDRILISEEWDNSFSNIKQSLLQRMTSDHVSVVLHCGHISSLTIGV